jgi:glycogen operon protein
MTSDRWRAEQPRAVAYVLNGAAITEPGPRGERIEDDSLYVAVNGSAEPLRFAVPTGHWPTSWVTWVDTASGVVAPSAKVRAGDRVEVGGRSVVVLVAD